MCPEKCSKRYAIRREIIIQYNIEHLLSGSDKIDKNKNKNLSNNLNPRSKFVFIVDFGSSELRHFAEKYQYNLTANVLR
jgi:hypothetical protein